MKLLEGKRDLVVGIANEHSIAAGCGYAFKNAGAELAVTYGREKSKRFEEPVAQDLSATILCCWISKLTVYGPGGDA